MSAMNNNWFVITDYDSFVEYTRNTVYFCYANESSLEDIPSEISLTLEEKSELDIVLSFDEASDIINSCIKKQINSKTKEKRSVLNEKIYMQILQDMNTRLTSNLLRGLVDKGELEMGYDNDANDFIFWVPDNKKIGE